MGGTRNASRRSYRPETAKRPDSISRATLKKLKRLSELTHRSVPEIIDACVDREMDAGPGERGAERRHAECHIRKVEHRGRTRDTSVYVCT